MTNVVLDGESVEDIQFSVRYLFVRGRQLDGTYPGDPSTGVWPITTWRIQHGWGTPPEKDWPYDSNPVNWPPVEPLGIDAIARNFRGGSYWRILSLDDIDRTIFSKHPVLISLDITTKWAQPIEGRIERPEAHDVVIGSHSVTIVGYDRISGYYRFQNNWGAGWGDGGFGLIHRDLLAETLWEAWSGTLAPEHAPQHRFKDHTSVGWAYSQPNGTILHWLQLRDFSDEVLAWASAVESETGVVLEELFVRPAFRGKTYGTSLLRTMQELAAQQGKEFCAWIPYPDATSENLTRIKGLFRKAGLTIEDSGLRWAPLIASSSIKPVSLRAHTWNPPPPAIGLHLVKEVAGIVAGAIGVRALIAKAIREWVDYRNGRRIKLKVGEVELETTQLNQEEFLALLRAVSAVQQENQLRARLDEAGIQILAPQSSIELPK